jgi:hypothetical protein
MKDQPAGMSNFAQMLRQRNGGLLDELSRFGASIALARGEVQNVLDAI